MVLEVENVLLRTLAVKRNVDLAHHRKPFKKKMRFCIFFFIIVPES